jgi:hypothetical protein
MVIVMIPTSVASRLLRKFFITSFFRGGNLVKMQLIINILDQGKIRKKIPVDPTDGIFFTGQQPGQSGK